MTTPLVDSAQPVTAKRIGLFGGTFDPVHFGHLRPAVELAETFGLDMLYMLPNHKPAHRGPTSASTAHRIAMLQLAIANTQRLAVDPREALRDTASYTIDTLREIRIEQPQAALVFFMGLDAFAKFDTWNNWQGILEMANLVVIRRPSATHSAFSAQLLETQRKTISTSIADARCGVIEECDVTQLAISATDVRKRINNALTVRFLLPEAVSEYIVTHSLYRKSTSPE